MKDLFQRVVLTGKWLYGGASEKPVYVIEQNYDYWFEMEKSDGQLEANQKPELSDDGLIYYVRFLPLGKKPWSIDSAGCKTLEEAKAFAVGKTNGAIEWDQ